jgi:hypothetical protein
MTITITGIVTAVSKYAGVKLDSNAEWINVAVDKQVSRATKELLGRFVKLDMNEKGKYKWISLVNQPPKKEITPTEKKETKASETYFRYIDSEWADYEDDKTHLINLEIAYQLKRIADKMERE